MWFAFILVLSLANNPAAAPNSYSFEALQDFYGPHTSKEECTERLEQGLSLMKNRMKVDEDIELRGACYLLPISKGI